MVVQKALCLYPLKDRFLHAVIDHYDWRILTRAIGCDYVAIEPPGTAPE